MRLRGSALTREALAASGAAGSLSALLVWMGPPGSDLPAHLYQRTLFLEHGFALWNNFWYAGRYSFITYSLIYYPLAALLGIRLLAVATVAAAALAFAVVVRRQWGAGARWSSRTFALVWAGIVLSAAFPFALGAALALLAIWAVQARRLVGSRCWRSSPLAASPVAFLLLALLLAGIAVGRRTDRRILVGAGLALVTLSLLELCLWRIFPSDGRYPFSGTELAGALVFCAFGVVLSWRIERARVLLCVFPVYALACIVAYLVPSALGDNVIPDQVRRGADRGAAPDAAAVAAASARLRRARPCRVLECDAARRQLLESSADPASNAVFWAPAVQYLHDHWNPSYRVEAIDTVGHWDAFYLPRAGIPLARGWFRQDDFPENAALYGHLGPRAYLSWLRRLGVRYVVAPQAPPDYGAEAEADLVASDRLSLKLVFVSANVYVYEVPSPRPIVTGPGPAHVRSVGQSAMTLYVGAPGTYRIAYRYTPYWHTTRGCVSSGPDRMIRLHVRHPGLAKLTFAIDAGRALGEMTGSDPKPCT